jgi:uncharacterized protein
MMTILENLLTQIRPYYEAQDAGHDWAHIKRVVKVATTIARAEEADLAVVLPAAYLHDIVNVPKNHPERTRASELAADKAVRMLKELAYDEGKLPGIHTAILEHSWSRGIQPSTLEAAIVQDADRLDALGAIGVLRCSAVNVQLGSAFYDPQDPLAKNRELDDRRWMVDHYFTKLLKLPESMNTPMGKSIARQRAEFMRNFLEQLETEV